MRLKYYLRGLGLGIIFAVIIMMIGFHDNKQSMSDTEIIEKAKTLGMVEAKNISGTVADEYNSEKTDSSAANSDASSQKAETEQVRRYGVEQDQDPCKRCSPGDRKGPGKDVCSPSGAKWLPVRGRYCVAEGI